LEVALERRFGATLSALAVLLSVMASGAVIGYNASMLPDAILPGVYVAGVHVGDHTREQAASLVYARVAALMEMPVEVQAGGRTFYVAPAELGFAPDVAGAINRAYAVGRTKRGFAGVTERFRIARYGVAVPLHASFDRALLDRWLEQVEKSVERPPQDAAFALRPDGAVDVIPSRPGSKLDRSGVEERLRRAALSPDWRVVRLSLVEVAPAFSTAQAQALGLQRVIATFSTKFDPSDEGRTENIRIAAEALDGTLLAPGETFSFNKRVGPRVEALGYKEAPVIIDGELVPDIGGGVCQVSTTLYNAVLLAGLQVTARTPHSIPASYVPLGRDATVAYDYIDFKFRNDTGRHVMIKAWTKGNTVSVAIVGYSAPFRNPRLETEIVSVTRPAVEETKTADLPRGERRVLRQGREGYHVRVWRIIETDRGEVRELVSTSVYKPGARVIVVGEG